MNEQQSIARDALGVVFFATCMSCIITIPIVTIIILVDDVKDGGFIIACLAVIAMSFLFFTGLGGLGKLIARKHRNRKAMAHDGGDPTTDTDEARLMQQLYQVSQRMEHRMEALETILMDHDQTRRAPASQERDK